MPTVQKQHVDIHRKLMLRRRLLSHASDGLVYVPFIGDGDIAAELYDPPKVCGADLAPERCERARGRLPGANVRVADCGRWPFGDVHEPFSIADFDAYVDPYEAFRGFWETANKTPTMVMFFTDGHRQGALRAGVYVGPDGNRQSGLSISERRRVFNFYFPRYVYPWFEQYIAPWSLSHKSPSLIYAKTVMTISDFNTMHWCVIQLKISLFPRKRESTEGGLGRRLTSETGSLESSNQDELLEREHVVLGSGGV